MKLRPLSCWMYGHFRDLHLKKLSAYIYKKEAEGDRHDYLRGKFAFYSYWLDFCPSSFGT